MTRKENTLEKTIKKMEKEGIHIAGLVFYDYSKITKKNPKPKKIVVIEEKNEDRE